MSSLVDKDGVIHKKGWDGQYRPQQGWFGPEKDTDFWGRPNVERGVFGKPVAEENWLGQKTKSNQGTTLYRRSGSSSSRSSSSGDEALAGLAVLVVIIAVVIVFAAFLLVVAPLFIAFQRGMTSAQGRRDWGIFALAAAALFGQVYLSVLAWNTWVSPYAYQNWQILLLPALAGISGLSLGLLIVMKGWLPHIWTSVRHVAAAYGFGVREMWGKVWSWV